MKEPWRGITIEQFEQFRDVRMGKTNPERMDNPFWHEAIRYGGDGYRVGQHFGIKVSVFKPRPIWCFQRFGRTETVLPDDGGVIFIGGEHEDSYDPDFAIYNDVVIRRLDGTIEIYGYPRAEFSPTDFHTATLVDNFIYIVGRLGYAEERILGTTPVYRLELSTMRIHEIEVLGEEPGWIYRHEALYWKDEHAILVWGGTRTTLDDDDVENTEMWAFSIRDRTWRKLDSITLRKNSSPWIFD